MGIIKIIVQLKLYQWINKKRISKTITKRMNLNLK